MSYQAVIRNSSDQLVTNQQIAIKMYRTKGSADGTTIYSGNPGTHDQRQRTGKCGDWNRYHHQQFLIDKLG
ncbi:MAG: hypothetical protein R2757_21400 [Draconibacterium sp.]